MGRDTSDYKLAKEQFVSDQIGGSVFRINSVCLTALTTYALWIVLAPKLGHRSNTSSPRVPFFEFLILVLPLLLSLTVLAAHPLKLNAFLTSLVFLFNNSHNSQNNPPDLGSPVPPTDPPSPDASKSSRSSTSSISKEEDARRRSPQAKSFSKPFVTVYRAHMMLMTIICILAVDFPAFPREFAKAETWGTSIMDLGVGSFVFGAGMVAALPLLRDLERPPLRSLVTASIKRSAGVIALGLVRLALVKGVEYPEHATEYGIHWNFFFTLGTVPILATFCDRIATTIDHTWLALIISLGYQLVFDRSQLQFWALTAERTTLLTQNKEGIVSIPGYLAIFLLGTATGLYTFPPDPYFFERQLALYPRRNAAPMTQEKRQELEARMHKSWKQKPGKLASVLGSYAIMWWTLYAVLRYGGWDVSRRLANFPYVVWIAAFNATFLFGYLVLHMWATQSPFSDQKRKSSRPISPAAHPPAIFDAMNRNSLLIFLIANLLTGLVNLTMQTMYASNGKALIVLLLYCGACTTAAWVLRTKRLRI
ncbi:GWT1-domain-containing protein [Meredithblackwellia eburnea MCA 4105]